MKATPRFQFGLSTLLAGVITAGVLLALNVLPAPVRITPAAWLDPQPGVEPEYGKGWPFPVYPDYVVHHGRPLPVDPNYDISTKQYDPDIAVGYDYGDGWKLFPALITAACNLGILWIVVRLFERRARRMRAAGPAPDAGT